MPEDFYAALMMRRALPTTTNIKTITAPGIYPVDAGNANAPGSAAGALIVLPPASKPKLKFIKESDANVYTLIGSDWKKPTATDVDAVPATRKVNGHALSSDVNVLPSDIFNLATGIGDAADLNVYTAAGLYYQPANAQATTGKNYPETVAGSLEVFKHAGITQIYRVYNNSRSYIRSLYGGTWTAWTKQYDAANKPTAADVGALPSNGNAVSATKLQTARTINGVAFDGTANITISASAVGSYTKAESDSRYPLKTATVIGVRVSARGSMGSASSGTADIDAPVGSFITGRNSNNGDARYSVWYTRALQINVNGAWKTITA